MKKLCYIFLLLSITIQAQFISLPSKWKLKMGDDPSYKMESYNDNDWQLFSIPTNWENQGYPEYDGYAWYRVRFSVPKNQLNSKLYIYLGKIDDADETFINGELIGKSGKFPPQPETAWNTQRCYAIPKGVLKEENVLAIRVHDSGGGGGIHSGLVGVYDDNSFGKEANRKLPAKSFYQITTSNGLVSAVFNEKLNVVESVTPHIFRMYDLAKPVSPFVKSLRLNNNLKPLRTSYVQNTHVIKVEYKDYTVFYLASFVNQEKIFVAAVEGDKRKIEKIDFAVDKIYADVLIKTCFVERSTTKAQKYFFFSFNDSLHNNTKAVEEYCNLAQSTNLVEQEVAYMRSVIEKAHFPKGISKDEKNLYEQSISILKMGQVSQKEIFPKSRGQILASLPPGNWNIGWLRDACYAVMALSQAGMYAEAKNALSFFLNADAGYYKNFVWKDGVDHGVGSDYKLSVCRYFGIGKEESDFNEFGPNIELDGFGLFLTAFSDYINKSGDKKFFEENEKLITRKIAKPIISFIQENNLIRKESGPWEQHLPGRMQAFTSIVSSSGLRDYAELLKSFDKGKYQKYLKASERLKGGILENLFYEGKFIKGFAEAESPATKDFYDGGTIEAFTQKVISDKDLFLNHYNEYDRVLRRNKKHGFARLNNPDWYTNSEWAFLDLRFAIALNNFGQKKEAKHLIDWVTTYSKCNFNFIAELYNDNDENYGGAVPMVGYGAGAYILTINNYYNK
jgi:GH15 family glucan-1,4-alpha-glucosidase